MALRLSFRWTLTPRGTLLTYVVFSSSSASHTAYPPHTYTQDAPCPSGLPCPAPLQPALTLRRPLSEVCRHVVTAHLPSLNPPVHLLVSQVACTQVHALFLRLQGSENWDTQRMEEVRACGVSFLSCRCVRVVRPIYSGPQPLPLAVFVLPLRYTFSAPAGVRTG